MSYKDTIWGARHKLEGEEIKRIIDHYEKNLKIDITILEASAIQALRSQDTIWDNQKAKKMIAKLRGIQI